MPIANKYSIKDILGAVNEYIGKTSRKVMFEYLLIDGVNDKEKNARALVCLMNKKLYMVNLIPCNPVGKYRPSSKKVIQHFKSILEENKINVTQRLRLGEDIKGACGQLATINSHKTRIH